MAGEKKRYTLGRGELHFAQFKPGTLTPRGELYMGNSPAFGLTATVENLDHYSSDGGVRKKDDSIMLQQDYAGSATIDNIDTDNLAIYLMGDKKTISTIETQVAAETLNAVEKGRWYQLGQDATNPTGVRAVSAVTVKATVGASENLVPAVDYLVDPENGRIFIQPGGAITNGSSPVVAYTIGASTREQVLSAGVVIEGALRYLQKNPTAAGGSQTSFYMPHVKWTPNGDFQFKGDTWQEMQFNIEIIAKGSLASIYADGAPYTPS